MLHISPLTRQVIEIGHSNRPLSFYGRRNDEGDHQRQIKLIGRAHTRLRLIAIEDQSESRGCKSNTLSGALLLAFNHKHKYSQLVAIVLLLLLLLRQGHLGDHYSDFTLRLNTIKRPFWWSCSCRCRLYLKRLRVLGERKCRATAAATESDKLGPIKTRGK